MGLINSFVVKKSIVSKAGFRPMASFLHTIILPKSSYPYTAFALSDYMFIQFWYRDEKEHSVKVAMAGEDKNDKIDVETYTLPQRDEDKRVFQQALILPRIVVSKPQAVWITTYYGNKIVQEYPIEFLYK